MFHRQLCCVFFIATIVNVCADVFIPAWMDFYSNPTTAPEERAAGSELTTVAIVPLPGHAVSDKVVENGNNAVLPTLADILNGGKTSGNNSEADFKINETDGSVSFVGGKKHNETDSSSESDAEVDTSGSNGETKADSNPLSINGTKTGTDVQHVHVCSTDLHNMTCQLTPVNASGADIIASDGEKTSGNNAETSGNSKDASSGSENQDAVIVAVDTDKPESSNDTAANSENSKKEKDSSSSSSEEEKEKKHSKNNDHHHKNR